jgi:hypothetical protein
VNASHDLKSVFARFLKNSINRRPIPNIESPNRITYKEFGTMKLFTGRVVLGGNVSGECIVSRQGMNILATYFKGLPSKSPTCNDQNNPYLYKKVVARKILSLPQAIGSTMGGMIPQVAVG